MNTSAPAEPRPSSRATLVLAVLAAMLIGRFLPHGRTLLYPLTLLATWVHEMGHGLAAIAVGGGFERLEIFADASGLAHTSQGPGAPSALVALGGLVAPPFVGALLLFVARGPRWARLTLGLLGLALFLSTLSFVRGAAGLIAVPLLGLGFLAAARFTGGSAPTSLTQIFPQLLAQFVALHLALDTLGRGLSYLFTDAVLIDGEKRMSDIAAVAEGFGGPRLLWSLVISVVCIVFIALGMWLAYRVPTKRVPTRS